MIFHIRLNIIFCLGLFMAAGSGDGRAGTVASHQSGESLAAQLRSQRRVQETQMEGVLHIRDADGNRDVYPVHLRTYVDPNGWREVYATPGPSRAPAQHLTIVYTDRQPPRYLLTDPTNDESTLQVLEGEEAMIPFAQTDFWLADLGLQFLYWPRQQIVDRDATRKGRDCFILESVFSKSNAQGYVRVKSWVDIESGGILQAEAFDRQGEKIKEFALTSFEKIEDQWHLKEMEIRNLKSDSRTRLEFELTVD